MQLQAHSAATGGPVESIEADAVRDPAGWLRLYWRLAGRLELLRLPAAAPPARADGLWRHTCFEAFVASGKSPAYCELNFSPSGEWAAYRFTGYRDGMRPLDLPDSPAVRLRRAAGLLALDVSLRLDALIPGGAAGPLRVGLSAVIEGQSGTITYWALRHPPGEPDFHHPDGFALDVAGPVAGIIEGTDKT